MRVERKTYYICDICGKEIETEYILGFQYPKRYEFKYIRNRATHEKDMCDKCFKKFLEFVKEGEQNG